MSWNQAQRWEKDWWSNCLNTYGEEEKQLLYANRMGLQTFHDGKSPYNIDLDGASVLDIGGGPVSLLLKCHNFSRAKVIDPLLFPNWIYIRYQLAHIQVETIPAEEITEISFDEVWLYNVLQHTQQPQLIIKKAQSAGAIIRIFEWLETRVNEGHPHSFTEAQLNGWLKGEGRVEVLNGQANCYGKCYYGIFTT